MLTENLFDEILVQPVRDGANKLLVVSGYASANMAYRHLDESLVKERKVRVALIYGMAPRDGVLLTDHEGFMRLEGTGLFECHYRVSPILVHSKVYVWMADNEPVKAFTGSANYTQAGFSLARNQGEAMAEDDPQAVFKYFELTRQGALEIGHDDIEKRVRFHNEGQQSGENSDCRTVPLVGRDGEVQASAGLNWGFRQQPGYNRNLNEAYIQIGAQLGREDFFPPRPTRFTIITDDGASFIAVRAQKSEPGDAIETPENNSILGQYFRNRLGIVDGTFITTPILDQYGRRDVEFCKIDEETFQMDFSV